MWQIYISYLPSTCSVCQLSGSASLTSFMLHYVIQFPRSCNHPCTGWGFVEIIGWGSHSFFYAWVHFGFSEGRAWTIKRIVGKHWWWHWTAEIWIGKCRLYCDTAAWCRRHYPFPPYNSLRTRSCIQPYCDKAPSPWCQLTWWQGHNTMTVTTKPFPSIKRREKVQVTHNSLYAGFFH